MRNLYMQIAASHLGSSALFGSVFFAATLVSDGLSSAASAGALAALSWFGAQPLLKRLIGAINGA